LGEEEADPCPHSEGLNRRSRGERGEERRSRFLALTQSPSGINAKLDRKGGGDQEWKEYFLIPSVLRWRSNASLEKRGGRLILAERPRIASRKRKGGGKKRVEKSFFLSFLMKCNGGVLGGEKEDRSPKIPPKISFPSTAGKEEFRSHKHLIYFRS